MRWSRYRQAGVGQFQARPAGARGGDRDGTVRPGRRSPRRVSTAYAALAEILRGASRSRGRQRSRRTSLAPVRHDRARKRPARGRTRRLAYAALIGGCCGERRGPARPRRQGRDRLVAVRSVLESLGVAPLVIAVEDIHLADEGMLDLIERSRRGSRADLIVCSSARPARSAAALEWRSRTRRRSPSTAGPRRRARPCAPCRASRRADTREDVADQSRPIPFARRSSSGARERALSTTCSRQRARGARASLDALEGGAATPLQAARSSVQALGPDRRRAWRRRRRQRSGRGGRRGHVHLAPRPAPRRGASTPQHALVRDVAYAPCRAPSGASRRPRWR